MKRYLVFVGSFYYPSGGGNDFVFATDDLEEAREKDIEARNKDMIGPTFSTMKL